MMARDANERSAATSSALPQRTDELVAEHDAFGNVLKETSGAPSLRHSSSSSGTSPSAASGKKKLHFAMRRATSEASDEDDAEDDQPFERSRMFEPSVEILDPPDIEKYQI